MKYLVTECHTGYAVLMDEEARVYKAANLHYTVGQTVTDPVLLDDQKQITQRKHIIMKVTAAAACLLLVSGIGLKYYFSRHTAESVVVVISETQYEMQLNRSGKVVRVISSDEESGSVVEQYDGKPQSAAEAVNSLLQLEKAVKELADGDTVDVLLEADSEDTYETCKSDLENEAAKLNLNANVQERSKAQTEPPVTKETETGSAAVQPPVPPEVPEEPPVKPDTPPQPPQPGTEPAHIALQPGHTEPEHPKPDENHTEPTRPVPEPDGTKPTAPPPAEPDKPGAGTLPALPADPPQPPEASDGKPDIPKVGEPIDTPLPDEPAEQPKSDELPAAPAHIGHLHMPPAPDAPHPDAEPEALPEPLQELLTEPLPELLPQETAVQPPEAPQLPALPGESAEPQSPL